MQTRKELEEIQESSFGQRGDSELSSGYSEIGEEPTEYEKDTKSFVLGSIAVLFVIAIIFIYIYLVI